ncbi:dihydrolipoamide acyltransferase [Sulfuriferula thiophila]|uniref:dihydrolipoamide acyltransferase n=1 Tax=Sulfuriferula thiophila TaxID=1781211 RepID=UPI000F61516C|nr:dihydrolipoamide acyltransferase [Sulfuriferula thiophila]
MSRIFQQWIFPIMMLAVLSGCANLPGQTRAVNGSWAPSLLMASQTDELLLYYDYQRKQSAPELAREYDKARQSLGQSKSDVNRLRVALLLTLPNTAFHDNATALEMANELLKDTKSTTSGLRGLANLLSVTLTEQQRLTDDLSQKWKDEKKRADGLQDKVEAIKNMEKNLMRRDQH